MNGSTDCGMQDMNSRQVQTGIQEGLLLSAVFGSWLRFFNQVSTYLFSSWFRYLASGS